MSTTAWTWGDVGEAVPISPSAGNQPNLSSWAKKKSWKRFGWWLGGSCIFPRARPRSLSGPAPGCEHWRTILMVTHDTPIAAYSQRTIHLLDGRIVW